MELVIVSVNNALDESTLAAIWPEPPASVIVIPLADIVVALIASSLEPSLPRYAESVNVPSVSIEETTTDPVPVKLMFTFPVAEAEANSKSPLFGPDIEIVLAPFIALNVANPLPAPRVIETAPEPLIF